MSSFKRKQGILGGVLGIILLLVTVALPAPASAATYPITRTDDLGRDVTITEEPMTIVSLAPSNTEILFELGLGDKIIGVSDYCDYPAEVSGKTRVGGPWSSSINVETIVSLDPDFILAASINGENVVNTLEGFDLTVFGIESTDLDDLLNDITTIGELTNAEAAAATLTGNMQDSIDAVTDETSGIPEGDKPSVMHIMYHDPIWTAGDNTYINDLLVHAGGVNIFADLSGYASVGIETVIDRDPDVIIVTAMGGTSSGTWDWVNTDPRLAEVSAIQNGRIYFAESNWLERAGPRIVLGLELVAEYLHPDIFFDPWEYDTNSDSAISKAEAIAALQDYFNGLMAKLQAVEVVMLYFG